MDGYPNERHPPQVGVNHIRREQLDPEVKARERRMLKLIIFGGCLIALGFLVAIMGISGIGGIIVILMGALVVATAVILAYRVNREYSGIYSEDTNQSEHFPTERRTYQGVNNVSSSSPFNTAQPTYNNQQQSPISQALFIPSPPVSHGTGIGASAPSLNVNENDNPPSYDELFSNK